MNRTVRVLPICGVIALFGALRAAEPMVTADISVDVGTVLGPVKPMHAVNNGPSVSKPGGDQKRGNFVTYRAACIPFARTHDANLCSNYGGPHVVDIANGYYPRAYDIDIYRFGNSQIIHCPSPYNGAYHTISPPALTGGKHSRHNFKHFPFQPFGLRRRVFFFLPSGRLVRRLFSFHFPVAGWLRELCNKNPKKEPHMANGNTNPGIGKNADSGVMHNPISQGFAQDLVSREGQRPRCPCGGESGSGDAAPPGMEANRG